MEIIRSNQSVPASDFIDVSVELVKNNFEWHKIEHNETGTCTKLYLSDTIYINFNKSDSTNSINICDDVANNYYLTVYSFSNFSYYNITIFKINEHSGAMAFGTSSSSTNASYSNTVSIVFDTTNKGVALFKPSVTEVSAYIIDGIDTYLSTAAPMPYNSSIGYSTNYLTSQIIPLVNAKTGVKYDNICGIVHSNIEMGNFVDFDGSKYLFSAGLAIPCGEEIIYKTTT